MKCPKCGYLGFESVDRCRNCGYDFSFTPPSNTPDLPIRSNQDEGLRPLDDLALVDTASRSHADQPDSQVLGNRDRSAKSGRNADLSSDLPLFGPALPDDEPLITRSSPPRQPLSVRRATPDVQRLRPERPVLPGSTPMLDLEPAEVRLPSTDRPPPGRRATASRSIDRQDIAGPEPAGVAARVLAVVVDVLVLAITDVAVIYFTMQICGLTSEDLGILPKGPLIAFLIVQNGGYLVTFTAGGQTLGKMAAGIRVVSADPGGSVDLGHSMVRTIIWGLLAVPAGLGFVSALFNPERRGLHDRCAGTRVVRAAA